MDGYLLGVIRGMNVRGCAYAMVLLPAQALSGGHHACATQLLSASATAHGHCRLLLKASLLLVDLRGA